MKITRGTVLTMYLLLVAAGSSIAQYSETISTDRPGQAIGPLSVGKNIFQLQIGADAGGSNNDLINYNSSYQNVNGYFRYGILENFELNFAGEFRNDMVTDKTVESSFSGFSLAAIGMRYNIFEGEKAIPAIGFQFSLKMPVLSAPYNFNEMAPQFLLITSQPISNRVSLSTNLGASYDGNTSSPTGLYVVNMGISISDKWSTYIENYGNFNSAGFNTYFDTGLGYLVTNDFQLDIYGGGGMNNDLIEYFVSLGISYRTGRR